MVDPKILGKIRPAEYKDAKEILRIYSPHVLTSAVSFELSLPTEDAIVERIHKNQKYGWLVFEGESGLLGYAYGSEFRSREAFQWSCEVSVYVDQGCQGRGLGTLLYERLFKQLKDKGVVNAYAAIALPNPGSVRMHEKLGFDHIGTFKKTGHKLGVWHDVGFWGICLNDSLEAAFPPRPI